MRHNITEMTVMGFHIDAYAHVNNARYLEFLEAARWQYYAKEWAEKTFEKNGWNIVIVKLDIHYRQAAVLGDILEIETSLHEVKRATIQLKQQIRRKIDQKIVANAHITFAVVCRKTLRPLRIAGKVREVLVG